MLSFKSIFFFLIVMNVTGRLLLLAHRNDCFGARQARWGGGRARQKLAACLWRSRRSLSRVVAVLPVRCHCVFLVGSAGAMNPSPLIFLCLIGVAILNQGNYRLANCFVTFFSSLFTESSFFIF